MQESEAWNAVVVGNAPRSGAFLQSWEWGEYRAAAGETVVRVRAEEGGSAAVAQAEVRALPLGMKVLYVPRGPIASGPEALAKAVGLLRKEAKATGSVALRIDPVGALPALRGRTPRPLQPQTTVLLDLTKSEDELLAGMHEKTRYNVRLAAKKGVHVREGGKELFPDLWRLLEASAKRDRFRLHPAEHYEAMLDALAGDPTDRSRCVARIVMAEHQSRPIAAMITISFGDDVVYLHGGSADEYRNVMAPYALHWEAIRLAKSRGYRRYDLWGIAPEGAKGHPLAGVTRFKRGFGGETYRSPDSLELPISPFRYTIYALVQKARGR